VSAVNPRWLTMIRTCSLIAVLIAGTLIDLAHGNDLVECEPQRVTGDGRHWAYRIVDGRECWYPGRPGKPKNELFWDRGITSSARQPLEQPEAETEPSEPPPRLAAAPPEKPQTPEPVPDEWRATPADQLLAFTCCWPELEQPALLPQPTSEGGEPPAWPLALLPLGLYVLWWTAKPRRALRSVRAGDAGRVAAAQSHPRAPPMHTGLDESATSLFVLPVDERQHVSIASLVDAPDPVARPGVRRSARYWVNQQANRSRRYNFESARRAP
jgi:hypothetical protein